jgi:hypothetical protein
LTTYSNTVVLTDNELLLIENLIKGAIKRIEESNGEVGSIPNHYLSALDKLQNAEHELRSWSSFGDGYAPAIGSAGSALSPDLIKAYEATDFHVTAMPPFALGVNRYCGKLDRLFKNWEASSAAFITAYNPYSESLATEENALRNQRLQADIKNLGFRSIGGFGTHPDGEWESEDSFFVLDISLEGAKELGAAYGQNAIVWCGEDAIPRLVLLR